jgi:hypothetical protein
MQYTKILQLLFIVYEKYGETNLKTTKNNFILRKDDLLLVLINFKSILTIFDEINS